MAHIIIPCMPPRSKTFGGIYVIMNDIHAGDFSDFIDLIMVIDDSAGALTVETSSIA